MWLVDTKEVVRNFITWQLWCGVERGMHQSWGLRIGDLNMLDLQTGNLKMLDLQASEAEPLQPEHALYRVTGLDLHAQRL